jgi:hypothetical protein
MSGGQVRSAERAMADNGPPGSRLVIPGRVFRPTKPRLVVIKNARLFGSR